MKSLRLMFWFVAMAALALMAPLALVAQDEDLDDAADVATGDDEMDAEVQPATPSSVESMVEEILGEDEDVYAGRGYGYDPAGRRDPFQSLLRDKPIVDRGPRPEGIPGLAINEIDLTGIFVLPEGPVAQVQTSDRDRSYLLRVGDKLYDGDVVSVSPDELVFRQILDDPTALTPFREVVKRLNP